MPEAIFTLPATVAQQIAGLPELPIGELRALWRETFAREPLIASRRFLERRIAYHWQAAEYEKVHPGVLAAQRARIAALAAALDAAKPARNAQLAVGTVLVRSYNGTDHEVRVRDTNIFEYAGKRYGSLSEVARAITGTRWSGPAFFGLKARTKVARS